MLPMLLPQQCSHTLSLSNVPTPFPLSHVPTPLPLAMFLHPFLFSHVAHTPSFAMLPTPLSSAMLSTPFSQLRCPHPSAFMRSKKMENFCVIIYLKFLRLKILTPNTQLKGVLNTKFFFNLMKHLK
jgi:hypothetical protein